MREVREMLKMRKRVTFQLMICIRISPERNVLFSLYFDLNLFVSRIKFITWPLTGHFDTFDLFQNHITSDGTVYVIQTQRNICINNIKRVSVFFWLKQEVNLI